MEAREDFKSRGVPFEYVNVLKSKDGMEQMLRYSRGNREVPTIVENGKVRTGWAGGS